LRLLPASVRPVLRRVHPTRTSPIHWPAIPLLLGAAALGFLVWQGSDRWSGDLSRLSPIERGQIEADRELRGALGGGDVRYLIATDGKSLEAALQASEETGRLLEKARDRGLIESWQAASDLLPSEHTQRQRLAAWPAPEQMKNLLASAGAGFRADAFEPFLADLAAAQASGPITREFWQGTPLAARLDSLLPETDSGWRALIQPAGLADARRLAAFLEDNQAPA